MTHIVWGSHPSVGGWIATGEVYRDGVPARRFAKPNAREANTFIASGKGSTEAEALGAAKAKETDLWRWFERETA